MSIVSNHEPELVEELNAEERPIAWCRPRSRKELDRMYGAHLEASIRAVIQALEVEAAEALELEAQIGPDPFGQGEASALLQAAALLRQVLQ
jgi:hypothetical protein